jgi:hypothetical protein
MAEEIEALRGAYAALNRGDIPGFVRVLDPQVVRVERIGPTDQTFRGVDEVSEHISRARGTWAEGACEPARFLVAGDRVVVLVEVRVRLKAETGWREGRTADVFTFRDGRAVEFRTFGDEREGLAWAGVRVGPGA